MRDSIQNNIYLVATPLTMGLAFDIPAQPGPGSRRLIVITTDMTSSRTSRRVWIQLGLLKAKSMEF